MKKYLITEKAGRMVAGRSNNGAGSVLYLTEKEAEYELSLGTLIEAPAEEDPAPPMLADGDGGDTDTEAGGADQEQAPEKQPAKGGKGK